MVVAFLVDGAVGCLGLGIQFLGIHLHASPLILGLLGTSSSLAYALMCMFSGNVSDRLRRRLPAVLACTVAGTIWLLMLPARSPYYLLLLIPFSGASLAFLWPSLQAWLAELSGENRRRLNRNLSLFNLFWGVGLMLGQFMAGYLWESGQYLPFIVPTAMAYLAILVLFRTPMAERIEKVTPAAAGPQSPQTIHTFMLLAWIGNFASWFCRATVGTMFPELGHELSFATSLVGILVAVMGIAMLVSFALARLSERWHYHLRFLIGAELIGLAGMWLAAVAVTPFVFALGFALAGLCSGITYVSSLSYALHGGTEGRGKRSGFHEAVLGSGAVIGPLVGGVLGETLNMHAPFGAAAVVYGLAIAGQLILWRRRAGQ